MSQFAVAAFSAIIGALVATIVSFYSGLRGEYGVRAARMLALKGDFERADRVIAEALKKSEVWPEQYPLTSYAWGTYGGDLVLHHRKSSWERLHQISEDLELTDCWANELRVKAAKPGATAWSPEFEKRLATLRGEDLPAGLEILEAGLAGARSRYRFRWVVVGFSLLVLGVWLVALLNSLSSPALTSSSLERAIEGESAAITKVICDQRRPLEGAYVCAVDYSPCAGRLEASVAKGPVCAAKGRAVVKVAADDNCWAPTFFKSVSAASRPPDQGRGGFIARLKKKLQQSGCILS